LPPELLGPLGLTVGALLAVGALGRVIQVLWREHLKADQDDRDQRDTSQSLAKAAIDAYTRLADAWEQRNRDDAERRRRND